VTLLQRSDTCYQVAIDGRSFEIDVLRAKDEHSLWMAVDGHAAPHVVMTRHDAAYVFVPGAGSIRVDFLSRFRSRPGVEAAGSCRAAITGRVVEVHVTSGARVRAGDRLFTLESMKMEHATVAASDGTVTRLWATTGQVVEQGALLVEIETGSAAATPPIQGD
jgi:3-methylcrotonyl-CoA carboxylase alpha subunit